MPFNSIADVRAANRAAGLHFFEPATMRFFRSRVVSKLYAGRYFITRERCGPDFPAAYTIRVAHDSGAVETVGAFQRFDTIDAARSVARRLAKGEIK